MRDNPWMGVAVGGFAGALCRYWLSGLSVVWNGMPLNILTINIIGAFLLGFFLELSMERLALPVLLKTGISTGFLGAFTTFSGLCAEAFELGSENAGRAGLYLFVSIAGGILAAVSGVAAARKLVFLSGENHE